MLKVLNTLNLETCKDSLKVFEDIAQVDTIEAVSYTHLTLPTILLV